MLSQAASSASGLPSCTCRAACEKAALSGDCFQKASASAAYQSCTQEEALPEELLVQQRRA